MKHFKSYFLLSMLALSTLFLTSCGEDDEVADPRDQAVGTYNYVLQIYDSEGEYLGSEYDEIGTLIVKKSPTNSTSIEFWEGGELLVTGTKLAEATNGFTFDIDPQTSIDDDGITTTIQGIPFWDLGGTKYEGFYEKATKEFHISFIGTYDDIVLILTFNAVKAN